MISSLGHFKFLLWFLSSQVHPFMASVRWWKGSNYSGLTLLCRGKPGPCTSGSGSLSVSASASLSKSAGPGLDHWIYGLKKEREVNKGKRKIRHKINTYTFLILLFLSSSTIEFRQWVFGGLLVRRVNVPWKAGGQFLWGA